MAIGTYAKVTASGTFDSGDIWQNVFHIHWPALSSPITAAAAQLVADQFEDFYTAVALSLWSSKTRLVNVSVQDMNAEGLIPWEHSYAITGPAVDTISQILACTLTLRNSTNGDPSNRGRVFVPMTSVDAMAANGMVIAAAQGTLTAGCTALGQGLNDDTDSDGLVVHSRKFSTNNPVDQATADNYAAVQRGRQNAVLKTKLVVSVPYNV